MKPKKGDDSVKNKIMFTLLVTVLLSLTLFIAGCRGRGSGASVPESTEPSISEGTFDDFEGPEAGQATEKPPYSFEGTEPESPAILPTETRPPDEIK